MVSCPAYEWMPSGSIDSVPIVDFQIGLERSNSRAMVNQMRVDNLVLKFLAAAIGRLESSQSGPPICYQALQCCFPIPNGSILGE